MDFPPSHRARRDQEDEDFVVVRLSRNEVHDSAVVNDRIAAAIEQAERPAVFAEFEPQPLHTVLDVLSGHITWEELSAHQVA
ncbi:hypothetical protein [Lentzea jiangxiensis]|uniref:Uncharacterized protein n=1 Tax=Lentzea jiangxiensis TaxID=641025 RepID=A0A1H0X384_9PSEU|nr:hypothetical protein [Lentzea jiangxiensis]SDP97413.1 hypothetical protein SAMN05421507_1318 [Lentzea jiangxiensis]